MTNGSVEQRMYGQTGEIGRDGILSLDQINTLNRIQENTAEACIQYLAQMRAGDKFPLIAMATGIGKGNIIHRVIERQMRQKPDSRVLVIAGTRRVLIHQTQEALANYQSLNPLMELDYQEQVDLSEEYINLDEVDELTEETSEPENIGLEDTHSFLYSIGKYGQSNVNVQVATIQGIQYEQVKGNLSPDDFDLVIVDEVHNVGTRRRLEAIRRFKKVIGFTATPHRYSGEFKFPDEYGFTAIKSLNIQEAQELQLLPPLVGIQVSTAEIIDRIPVNSDGRINYAKLERLLKQHPQLRPLIADKVTQIINSEGKSYKTIIAVNFVWEAQELAQLLHDKGIKVGIAVNQNASRQLDSEQIPARRAIERYKLPEGHPESLQVIVSPYVAGEGVDAPFTEVLVWASPTDSYLRYTQYVGRLARRAEGKFFGTVVDCLYQTAQYNYSYNFGMWVKGSVRQIDSGLLYLGPEQMIERLRDLPAIQSLKTKSDYFSIEELQKEALGEVLATDFPLIASSILDTFVGDPSRILKQAQSVIEELRGTNPDIIARRRSWSHIISVVTDREKFIKAILEKGGSLKDPEILELRDSDINLSRHSLHFEFFGKKSDLANVAAQIIELLRQENPALVAQRRFGSHIVTVATDRERFIQEMIQRGIRVKPKEIKDLQSSDFRLSFPSLRDTFRGDQYKVMILAEDVIDRLKARNPNIIVQRRYGSQTVTVATNKNLFIREMVAAGAILKQPNITELQQFDFPVIHSSLTETFLGKPGKLKIMADHALKELSREEPDLIKKRKHGVHVITAVIDRDRFIQAMIKQGAVKREGVKEIQETDFRVTQPNLIATFYGGAARVARASNEVLQYLKSTSPDIVVQRKYGSQTVTAVTDRDRFIAEMGTRGIRLKNS